MKWIIILLIATVLGLGFYFCPALTMQILSTIFKVFSFCLLGVVKLINKGVKKCVSKFKDWKRKRALKKKQESNNQVNDNTQSSPSVVININNLDDSNIFSNK